MNFISIDIRIGISKIKILDDNHINFHKNVINLLFPEISDVNRHGIDSVSFINHQDYVYNPGRISDIIIKYLDSFKNKCNIDTCILDFTNNSFVRLREPLLLSLVSSMIEAVNSDLCDNFIILLPELPGPNSAFIFDLKNIEKSIINNNYHILCISNSGKTITFSSLEKEKKIDSNKYHEVLLKIKENPISKINNKCVRRLGHFKSTSIDQNKKCRHYSYYINDCTDELKLLFGELWSKYNDDSEVIIYDLKNNISLREAVKSFCTDNNIFSTRIVDVLKGNIINIEDFKNKKILLVLDVVESGTTMLRYANELESRNLIISKNVLVAINKSGSNRSTVDSFNVYGLLSRPSESFDSSCIQCELKLPYTPDSHEPYLQFRSYDMFYMIQKCGWTAEPEMEVPDNIGEQLKLIPDFSKILDNFGDWLSYKIQVILKSINCPDEFFIIHPDQQDSTALTNYILYSMDEKIDEIKIPKSLITKAQLNNDQWDFIHEEPDAKDIIDNFILNKNSVGLIVDIFNASSSTLYTLYKLLNFFKINPFAYISMIDFDPSHKNYNPPPIPQYSLYDWYNPRKIK